MKRVKKRNSVRNSIHDFVPTECIKITVYAAAAAKSLQSCPTLRNPMDCSLPGFFIYGIFQARILEWVAIAFSKITVYSSFKKYYSDIIKIGHKRFYFIVKFFKHKYPSSPCFMKQNSEI